MMIHRAILGSLERFIALYLECFQGEWPFWLSSRQIFIVTVSDREDVVNYAHTVKENIMHSKPKRLPPLPLGSPLCHVDIDDRAEGLSRKFSRHRSRSTE